MDKRKVLIVEDSDFSRAALRDGLKDEYEIIEAADGEMALAILKVNKVDIVLLDIVLPKLDGISVLKKIREDVKLHSLPVIVVSAFDGVEREIECLDAGADDVMRKPVDNRVIKLRINNILMVRSAKQVDLIRGRMENVLNNVPCGIIRVKYHKHVGMNNGKIDFANDEYFKIRGVSKENYSIEDIIHGKFIEKGDFEETMATISKALSEDQSHVACSYRIKVNDAIKYIDSKATITQYGDYIYMDVVESDVTEQRKFSRQIEIDENKYSNEAKILGQSIELLPNGAILLKVTHEEVEVIGVNVAMLNYLGYERNAFMTLFAKDFLQKGIHNDEVNIFRNGLDRMMLSGKDNNSTIRIQKLNGEYKWVNTRVSILEKSGDVCVAYAVFMDIDELKEKADRDFLTGLLNRQSFRELVDADLKSPNGEEVRALIMIDIDNFKEVNDTYDHSYGDSALVKVANKLKSIFREDDYIARVGGDEFCIYIKNASKRDIILGRAIKACEEMQMTFAEEGKKVDISCSMGVAFITDKHISYDELFKHADTAQYSAKKNGKSRFVIWDDKTING